MSFPVGPVSQIEGVEVVERARGLRVFKAQPLSSEQGKPDMETWALEIDREAFPAPYGSDAAVVHEGRIAIVAMRAYEGDPEMGEWLAQNKRFIPAW